MKRFIFVLFSMFICINNIYAEEFDITSNKVITYNLNDDRVIYKSNENEITKVASLTKIVTAIVAIENISNLDDTINLSYNDVNGYSEYAKVGLVSGINISYKDLLYGVILSSGADATNALYNNVFSTNLEYINKMNELVTKLELKNTHFDNPIGVDSDNNYSTASDMAIILKYALSNDIFKEIFTTKSYYIESINKTITNNNIKDNIKGAKSGFTDGAGLCLASIYSSNNIDYLEIVLGTNKDSSALKESLTIYNYYNDNYSYREVIDSNKTIKKIKIKYIDEYYNIKGNIIDKEYIKNDYDINNIKFIYDGKDILDYNYKNKTNIGTIDVVLDNEVIDSVTVYLNMDIKEYYYPYLNKIIVVIILLFIFIILRRIFKRKKKKKKKRK